MFIFELFSYSQKQAKETLHSGFIDPEMIFPEAEKMDFITFWEQLPGIEFRLYASEITFWAQKNNLKVQKFKKFFGNFGKFSKSVQKFLNGN